jgi:hypothetical protein
MGVIATVNDRDDAEESIIHVAVTTTDDRA